MNDKETIRAEIKRLITDLTLCLTTERKIGGYAALLKLVSIIDSIKQEQQEVDFEKEIDAYLEPIQAWQIQEAPFTSMENCARHFYELGLNARKEK